MATSKGDASEFQWCTDYIMAFLKSPPWVVPVSNFIDEHCIVFDTDEENKLQYSTIHHDFIALVEGLLETHLLQLGVTGEQFAQAVEHGSNSEVDRVIFAQILAVDEFLTFKKMMVKRNMQLELDALRALQDADTTGVSKDAYATGADDEAAQIAEAIRLSQKHQKRQLQRQKSVEKADEYQTAVEASQREQQIRQQQLAAEQAELEAAIALSLQCEADRLAREASEKETAAAAAAAAALAEKEAQEKEAPPAYAQDAPVKAKTPLKQSRAMLPTPKKKLGALRGVGSGQGALPALTLSKLPDLDSDFLAKVNQFQSRKKAAEASFHKNSEQNRAVAVAEKQEQEQKSGHDDKQAAEAQKKAQFLRAHRLKLLMQKKKQRQANLGEFEANHQSHLKKVQSGDRSTVPDHWRSQAEAKKEEESSSSFNSSDEQRMAMRAALAQRLTSTFHDKQDRSAVTQSENKVANLDEQMRQLQILREKQLDEKNEHIKQAAENEQRRRATAKSMHSGLARSGTLDSASSEFVDDRFFESPQKKSVQLL